MSSLRKNRNETRSREGFSLITVLSLGLVSTLMLFALSASILPLYQKASQNAPYVQLRSAAESAINLTVADLNNALTLGQTSLYDDTALGAPYTTKYYSPPGVNPPTVKVIVKNEMPIYNPSLMSFVFDNSYDKGVSTASRPTNSSSLYATNPYRVVEALAYFDVNNAPQVMARSIIRQTAPPPVQNSWDRLGPTSFITSQSNNKPVFNYAAFGINGLSLGTNTVVTGYDSRSGVPAPQLAGDLGTNGIAKLSGSGINIDGSLTVSSPSVNPFNTSKVATADTPPIIHDQLIVNGQSDGSPTFKGTNGSILSGPQPSDTVRGESRGLNSTFQPIIQGASMETSVLPPTPAAPPTAYAVTSPSAGQRIVFKNGAQFPPSDASITAYQSGGTLNLPPGDYTFTSLNVGADGSNSSIKVASDVTQPVRIYVQGSPDGTINVQNQGIQNSSSSPSDLQLYYAGLNDVTLASSFNGVLYAPNAAINVAPPNGNLDVYGSIVGSKVSTRNSRLHFDAALSNSTFINTTSRPGPSRLAFDPTQYSNPTSTGNISYFKALSYQEMKNPQP